MTYISILRGINVSGQKKIKMAELKALYEDLEFQNVQTYIQSGNVVFQSPLKDKSALKAKIEQAIEKQYHFHVPVDIRTHKEFKTIINNCPFDCINLEENATKVLVTFVAEKPAKPNVIDLMQFVHEPEQLQLREKVAYLYCPNGYGKSKLSNHFLEKKLGVSATTRNWKSVLKLSELSAG